MALLQASVLLAIVVSILDFGNAVSFEKDISLTLNEKLALDKFREQMQPLLKDQKNGLMKTDIYLIRWLRLTNFDVNAAESMLKRNLKWRLENKMDSIQLENFDDMLRDFPTTVDTHDKEGRPVGVVDIYDWDIRAGIISGRGSRILRYLDMLMENVTNQVYERQQRGMNVTQWKVLSNTEGFNLIKHGCPICIPVWLQFVSSLETHYPGWLDEFIIVEAPSAVHTVLDLMRPVLSPQTRNTFKIFGMNRNIWMPYMDSKISRDQRRAHYGGTKI